MWEFYDIGRNMYISCPSCPIEKCWKLGRVCVCILQIVVTCVIKKKLVRPLAIFSCSCIFALILANQPEAWLESFSPLLHWFLVLSLLHRWMRWSDPPISFDTENEIEHNLGDIFCPCSCAIELRLFTELQQKQWRCRGLIYVDVVDKIRLVDPL
jgi:hypothetical protein